MALITVFMILLLAFVVQGADVKWPQNTVITAGSNVTIKCSSDQGGCSGVEWAKTDRAADPDIIYRITIFNKFNQTYSVDNSSGCNLVITNVQLNDAGRFTCTSNVDKRSQIRSATLIVLRSQPTCKVNVSADNTVEGDGVSLMCEVMYSGTNMTSVIWEGLEDNTTVIQRGYSINYSYSLVARATLVPAYSCVISFNVTNYDKGSAVNIPVTSCATPNLMVLYLGKNVTLNPSLAIYSPGSRISCSADGNPSPTYKWQQLLDMNNTWIDIRDGPEFVSSNATSSQYRCAAINILKGVNSFAYSRSFEVNSAGEATTVSTGGGNNELDWLTLGIAGVASVGVLLLLILITICFCARSCPGYKCCHSDKKSIDNSRTNDIQIQPMQETVYSNVNKGNKSSSGKSANPRRLPSQLEDPPKRPQIAAPPQPKPGKGGQNNKYDEPEELTYACLAGEQDPRKQRNVPNLIQECEYAGIGSA